MTSLDKLEKRFGRYAIANLTSWIMVGQIAVWGFGLFTDFPVQSLHLVPSKLLQGEVWRAFTFILVPPITGVSFWLIFIWYLFYFFGSTLEKEWGEFRFNCFMLIGLIATVIAGIAGTFLIPAEYRDLHFVANTYLLTSITFAFAILFPNYELLVFFVLPVKIKWIALFILGSWVFAAGLNPLSWLLIFAALLNIAVFFGRNFVQGQQTRQRRAKFERERSVEQAAAFHTCVICGKTDQDDPDMEFAYKDGQGYCRDHWDEMDKAG